MGARHSVVCSAILTAFWLVMLLSFVTAAPPVLTMNVDPVLAFAPADATVTIFIPPDAENAHLAVGIGSAVSAYASSSQKTLSGEDERREHRYIYKRIPPGVYLVVATVYDRNGKPRGAAERRVERFGRSAPDAVAALPSALLLPPAR